MKAFITAIGVLAIGFGAPAFAKEAPAKGKAEAKGTEYTVGMTGVV